MKKKLFYIFLMAVTLAGITSCAEKVDKNVVWPEWASRPIIKDIKITAGGKTSIVAGETVKLTGSISDDFNELSNYRVEVKYGDNVVIDKDIVIKGNETAIDCDLVMPFAAYLKKDSFLPEITVHALNKAGGSATQRVANENNIYVSRPESPEKLYAVDKNGRIFELKPSGDFTYRTADGTDLKGLGESFYIASALKGNAPDFAGMVWGMKDGEIVIADNGTDPIPLPETSGYGLRTLGFDTYSFNLEKTVDLTVELDKGTMESQEQGGVTYLAKENVRLVRDCEIVFKGFGELSQMLQPDRFRITGETTAVFTGHTQDWSIYYDTDDNWLIVDYAIFNTAGQIWVTGTKACFPLGNDETVNELNYLKGDGKDRYATLAAVKSSEDDFSILLYLKEGFAIQLFRWIKWSTTISMTSLTENFAKISDDQLFIRPGNDFIPGVYLLSIHLTARGDSGGDGSKADISLRKYEL